MTGLYPEIEPHESGLVETGDGNLVYWETCGNPAGRPAVMVHGGPGSGCSTYFRRLFDPAAWRIVLFDQRGCGRSRPHASDPATSLDANTTQNLVSDMELLRDRLAIEKWLVVGGSWGSTLSLAYAESHPGRVTGMVLFGVTTGRHNEFDWAFRGGAARFFPAQWDRLVAAVPVRYRQRDVVDSYAAWLSDPEPEERRRAALEWCTWESATPGWPPHEGLEPRFHDADHALAFARIVTHFVRHNAWLGDGILIRNARLISHLPAFLVTGRFDLQAPVSNAWELKRVWPAAELVIVDDSGHGDAKVGLEVVRATDQLAQIQL